MEQLLRGFGPQYPTRAEIMAEPWPRHKRQLVREIISWKKNIWKEAKHDSFLKSRALADLVAIMNRNYETECNFLVEEGIPSACYKPVTKTIHMNESLSILSTMHEFAHHRFGASERKACRWSVHLFRKTFPKAYEKLEWQGHCLVKV